jgi:hypothetical protein
MGVTSQRSNGVRPGVIVGGGFLLVVGISMLLDRTGVSGMAFGRLIGPACLILLGTHLLLQDRGGVSRRAETLPDGTTQRRIRRRGASAGGLWMLGVGCWMLVSQFHVVGLDYHTSWPLLVILSGIIMLVKGTR